MFYTSSTQAKVLDSELILISTSNIVVEQRHTMLINIFMTKNCATIFKMSQKYKMAST